LLRDETAAGLQQKKKSNGSHQVEQKIAQRHPLFVGMAAKGCRAVTFSENPEKLGWPSYHSAHWDPFWRAVSDTGTVVCLHIGSSSQLTITSVEAPLNVMITLQPMNTEERPHRYKFTVDGLPEIEIDGATEVEVPAATLQSFMAVFRTPPEAGKKGANQIHFEIVALDNADIKVREKASFLLP